MEQGESSGGVQRPGFGRQPFHSQGPGETMGEFRHRISQLEAHAASVGEDYGPLIPTSYMHGVHIRVLEQDRHRIEAALIATQEEVERLRAGENGKLKGPAK